MPFKVFSPYINQNHIREVECGDNFSAFLTANGEVYAFGSNCDGQLGIGYLSQKPICEPSKVKVEAHIYQISCGFRHMLMLSQGEDQDLVFGCGLNQDYELAQNNEADGAYHYNPVLIPLGSQKV
jgi:alpha-tubulin suppressor-like RCC1 family protein